MQVTKVEHPKELPISEPNGSLSSSSSLLSPVGRGHFPSAGGVGVSMSWCCASSEMSWLTSRPANKLADEGGGGMDMMGETKNVVGSCKLMFIFTPPANDDLAI